MRLHRPVSVSLLTAAFLAAALPAGGAGAAPLAKPAHHFKITDIKRQCSAEQFTGKVSATGLKAGASYGLSAKLSAKKVPAYNGGFNAKHATVTKQRIHLSPLEPGVGPKTPKGKLTAVVTLSKFGSGKALSRVTIHLPKC